jgi:hypothetical protein
MGRHNIYQINHGNGSISGSGPEGENMNSYEALKNAIEAVGAKAVASELGISPSLLYKWCEPKSSHDDSGAQNPLDRVLQIYEITGDVGPIEWLCQKTDGFRVANPKRIHSKKKEEILNSTQVILKEFSDLLEVISESYANDGKIDLGEAKRIRRAWEHLKVESETFVTSCEQTGAK